MNMLAERIFAECKNKKVLFVDCFDTLVYRLCSPETVIERWIGYIAKKYNLDYEKVFRTWKGVLTWQNSIKKDVEEFSFQRLCMELFLRLSYIYEIESSFVEFYNNVLENMILIEKSVLFVDDTMLKVLKMAKETGKRVYCVSDFYLPKDALERILSYLNINIFIENIYVSSEVGKRKSSGSLYKFVLEKENCKSTDVIMIGDNIRSDYKVPKAIEIEAYRYDNGILTVKENTTEKFVKKLSTENIEKKMYFADYAFTLYLFCEKLYNELCKKKYEQVYFFSREGEFLKKAFDSYVSMQERSIITKYLYVSRQSTFLPSLKNIQEENFETLKKQVDCISIIDFLKNLNIDTDIYEIDELVKKYDLEEKVQNFFDSNVFGNFCREKDFINIYEEKRREAKREVLAYLNANGVSDKTAKIAIVDIGWKGSIQDNLYRILDEKCEIDGYYYGLLGDIGHSKLNRKYGLVYSEIPFKSKNFDIYNVNHRMLERVLYASHGSCVYYQNSAPVLDEASSNEKELYEFVKLIQERMLFIIEELDSYQRKYYCSQNEVEQSIVKNQKYFLLDITKERMRQVQYMDCRQKMNFGDWGKREKKSSCFIIEQLKKFKRMSKIERWNKAITGLAKARLWVLLKITRKIAICTCLKR